MFKKIKAAWKMLNRSIYTGARLEQSLLALTAISIFTAIVGLVLLIMNIFAKQYVMLIGAATTLLCSLGCGYLAGVKKNRDAAIIIPTAFCAIAFTAYTVFGLADGVAMMWTIFVPIGIGYFVSTKYGILLSGYFTVLFFVLFYTPLNRLVEDYYSRSFILRFPIIYASLTGFTAIVLVEYHRGILLEMDYSKRLNAEVERQTRVARERADRLEKKDEEMVQTLAVAIDAKDRYTNGHSFRVSWYSTALAEKLGWPQAEIAALRYEALLHDIGKIGVPDAVLNKPGRLTDAEFNIIKSHASIGGDILARSESLRAAAEVARSHHERWDGRGYPQGLAGEQIPIHARVVAVADAYDAMRSDRIYRKGLQRETIREELVKGRGRQFDPEFLDAFLALMDDGSLLDEIATRDIASLTDVRPVA